MDNVPINMDKVIELGSKVDGRKGCGELVRFVISLLVRMEFEFGLGMPTADRTVMDSEKHATSASADDKPKGFRFTAKWSYFVTIKNPLMGDDTSIGMGIHLQDFESNLLFDSFKPIFANLLSHLWNKVPSPDNLAKPGS